MYNYFFQATAPNLGLKKWSNLKGKLVVISTKWQFVLYKNVIFIQSKVQSPLFHNLDKWYAL